MYTIATPSKKILDEHVNDLKTDITDLVKKYHPAHTGDTIKDVVSTQALKLDVKVANGSLTEWFLDWLLVDKNLERLLRGHMSDLLNIIRMVETQRIKMGVDEREVYGKMSATTYEQIWNGGRKLNPRHPISDVKDVFNVVVYQIFVTEGFDGEKKVADNIMPFFDKTALFDRCKLRICPYCGRSFIYAIDDGTGVVKPQIDHYIPKRKYPYLALSYFNLIPVCSTCNMSSCKGDLDPMITVGNLPFRISYPYDFVDSDYVFVLGILNSSYFEDANFNISIDFKRNTDLENGSNAALHLSEFYKHHNHEAASIYRQMMVLKSRANTYYSSFKLPKTAFLPSPGLILGFPFNEVSSRTEILYKLKKDVYKQLFAYFGWKP